MRIIYVAKHESGGNDDEGAIYHALTALGHDVERCREFRGRRANRLVGDFLLFHHWRQLGDIDSFSIPKVCWCFDLIDWPGDPTLSRRCAQRRQWAADIVPRCAASFWTDGDWVERAGSPTVHWLPQGADERVMCLSDRRPVRWPLLFTGVRRGGREREAWVDETVKVYGQSMRHVEAGLYREALREVIAETGIVLAPAAPVTDRYWSNRAVNAIGFGACLLHPWSAGLARRFLPGVACEYYHDMGELREKVDLLLGRPDLRRQLSEAGFAAVASGETYRHRCAEMVAKVAEAIK